MSIEINKLQLGYQDKTIVRIYRSAFLATKLLP